MIRIIKPEPHLFFHPNFNEEGDICDQILMKNSVELKMRDRLNEFVNLPTTPNPHSPLNN
jgi:ubiquitin-protein ligase